MQDNRIFPLHFVQEEIIHSPLTLQSEEQNRAQPKNITDKTQNGLFNVGDDQNKVLDTTCNKPMLTSMELLETHALKMRVIKCEGIERVGNEWLIVTSLFGACALTKKFFSYMSSKNCLVAYTIWSNTCLISLLCYIIWLLSVQPTWDNTVTLTILSILCVITFFYFVCSTTEIYYQIKDFQLTEFHLTVYAWIQCVHTGLISAMKDLFF